MYNCLLQKSTTLLTMLGLVLSNGCNSKSQRKLIPVSGLVKIDGEPLELGLVTVWVKDYRAALGMIDEDGRFTLMTYVPGDGCAVGEHVITVSSRKSIGEEHVKYYIPQKYDNPTESNLKINVDKPDDNLIIDLTWKDDPHGGPYRD